MNLKPIIFLAFANDREDNVRYLRNIPAEQGEIRQILIHAQERGICDYEILSYATFKDIKEVLTREQYRNRIVAFHFAGHADGFQLLLEQENGQNHSTNGENLSEYFRILKTGNVQANLQLLFFNGCCTENFAKRLQDVIPTIIATDNDINDEQAKSLAVSFYYHLCKRIDVLTAFSLAKVETTIQNGQDVRGLYRKGVVQEPNSSPWQLWSAAEPQKWSIEQLQLISNKQNNTNLPQNMTELEEFKKELLELVASNDFKTVFAKIKTSSLNYDKPLFSRLERQITFQITLDLIDSLQVFIGTLKK
jgi:hypothetical protein